MERRDRGGGGHVALFLMTLECDGNAVNEEGWDKTPCFPRGDETRHGGEEPDDPPAKLDAFCSRTTKGKKKKLEGAADGGRVG